MSADVAWSPEALEALRFACEDHVVGVFADAGKQGVDITAAMLGGKGALPEAKGAGAAPVAAELAAMYARESSDGEEEEEGEEVDVSDL